MYGQHFGLLTEAFALTPDPAFLYLSPGHAEAIAGLKVGLEGRRGLMVMVGEVGTGKTTLLYSLLSDLGPRIHTAYVSNTGLSFDDMLRQALADLGVPCESRARVDRLSALNAFLGRCAAAGETAALVVDEAQNLDDDAFENLRLLSNYETYTQKLLQIVLVGQPELDAKLARPALRQVAERVATRCHINPLDRAESRRYLAHRLRCAGGSTDLLTPAALRLVLRAAGGVPRRLNILCHTAFLFAYGRGESRVRAACVRAAIREKRGLGLTTFGPRPRQQKHAPGIWPVVGAAAAGAIVAIGISRGYLTRQVGGEAALLAGRSAGAAPAVPVTEALTNPAPGAPAPGDGPESVFAPQEGGAAEDGVEVPVAAGDSLDAAIRMLARRETDASPVEVAPAAADATGGSEPANGYREIVVPPGMSLTALMRQHYGSESPELLRRIRSLNPRIANIDHILAGDTLRLPDPEPHE